MIQGTRETTTHAADLLRAERDHRAVGFLQAIAPALRKDDILGVPAGGGVELPVIFGGGFAELRRAERLIVGAAVFELKLKRAFEDSRGDAGQTRAAVALRSVESHGIRAVVRAKHLERVADQEHARRRDVHHLCRDSR